MRENKLPVTSVEATAQAELRKVIEDLQIIRLRMEMVRAALPVQAEEDLPLEDEEDVTLATEIRSVIECVLNDSLRPAIRDLEAVAAFGSFSGEETKH